MPTTIRGNRGTEATDRPRPAPPGTLSLVSALTQHNWTLDKIDEGLRSQLLEIFYKAGKPHIRPRR